MAKAPIPPAARAGASGPAGTASTGSVGDLTGAQPGAGLEDQAAIDDRGGVIEEAVNEDNYEATMRATLPDDMREILDQVSPTATLLFAEACYIYGVNPHVEAREILRNAHGDFAKVYKPDPHKRPAVPERVRFVTAGGVKIVHPMDENFEDQLRKWLRAYRLDPKTNDLVPMPLPPELTLPREAVTGIPAKTEHVHKGGYLRERAAAAARSARG